MEKIDTDSLANIIFHLHYEDVNARHTLIHFAQRVNFWRDMLPAVVFDALISRSAGESVSFDIGPGEILDDDEASGRHRIKPEQFNRVDSNGISLAPLCGRFYPKGLLRDMPGIFAGNTDPFRCLSADSRTIEIDFNHPLAGRPLKLSAGIDRVIRKIAEHGGSSTDWMETLTNGPGMQSRSNGNPTDFFSNGAFARENADSDAEFYIKPRFVNHVDRQTLKSIRQLYADLIPPDGNLLDLMSSWTSHLPSEPALRSATGLGMNRSELEANERLNRHVVQDINSDPVLPFDSGAFDAAICSLSVEYLIQPMAVFDEVARVLKENGIFVVTFSNRWFPPKVIDIWTELHDFERMGLVLEYFLQSGRFDGLETLAVRGYPRPIDDKYFPQMRYADPLYAVWGRKKRKMGSPIKGFVK